MVRLAVLILTIFTTATDVSVATNASKPTEIVFYDFKGSSETKEATSMLRSILSEWNVQGRSIPSSVTYKDCKETSCNYNAPDGETLITIRGDQIDTKLTLPDPPSLTHLLQEFTTIIASTKAYPLNAIEQLTNNDCVETTSFDDSLCVRTRFYKYVRANENTLENLMLPQYVLSFIDNHVPDDIIHIHERNGDEYQEFPTAMISQSDDTLFHSRHVENANISDLERVAPTQKYLLYVKDLQIDAINLARTLRASLVKIRGTAIQTVSKHTGLSQSSPLALYYAGIFEAVPADINKLLGMYNEEFLQSLNSVKEYAVKNYHYALSTAKKFRVASEESISLQAILLMSLVTITLICLTGLVAKHSSNEIQGTKVVTTHLQFDDRKISSRKSFPPRIHDLLKSNNTTSPRRRNTIDNSQLLLSESTIAAQPSPQNEIPKNTNENLSTQPKKTRGKKSAEMEVTSKHDSTTGTATTRSRRARQQ